MKRTSAPRFPSAWKHRLRSDGVSTTGARADGPVRAVVRHRLSRSAVGEPNGLDLIPKLLAENPNLDIVAITAYGTVDTAVEAVKRGAVDYVQKPFTPDQIRHAVSQVADGRPVSGDWRRMTRHCTPLCPRSISIPVRRKCGHAGNRQPRGRLRYLGAAARRERHRQGSAGPGCCTRESPRREFPFVVINCPTLSEELLTSELFGHATASFTGAVRDQPGRVEAAEGGTLFLDEVAEIPPNLQAKLLRFLQERHFRARSANSGRGTRDVRIMAATNRNLEAGREYGPLSRRSVSTG